MSRAGFLAYVIGIIGSLSSVGASENRLPNMIYIIVDDMGYSDLGCFGGEIDTPHLDTLAESGVRFRQHYTFAKCETSRTAMLTGMFHHKSGLKINPESKAKTVAEVLKKAGYRTGLSGKWHMDRISEDGTKQHPLDRGFDYFYGLVGGSSYFFNPADHIVSEGRTTLTLNQILAEDPNYYMTDAMGQKGISFIESVHQSNMKDEDSENDEPFFLYLAFNAPHTPLQAPRALIDKYLNRGIYKDKGWEMIREERYVKQLKLGIVDPKWPLSPAPDHMPIWDELSENEQDVEEYKMAVFAAMVERVDTQVGELIAKLKDLGEYENTLIYFVSDNGASPYDLYTADQNLDMIVDEQSRAIKKSRNTHRMRPDVGWSWVSNTPYRYYKQNQYNGGVLTPMIVSWPAVIKKTNTISDYPTHIMDAVPTMADFAGVELKKAFPDSPSWDGMSLRPLFEDTNEPAREDFGLEFSNRDFGYVKYPWKLVTYRANNWSLYNLEEDRTELNNLAPYREGLVSELADEYKQWMSTRTAFAGGGNAAVASFDGTVETIANFDMVNFRSGGKIKYKTDPRFSIASVGTVENASIDTDITNAGRWTSSHRAAKIGANSDSFVFIEKPLSGDAGYITMRLDSLGATGGANRRGGLMYRESTKEDSPFIYLEVNQNSGSPLLRWRVRNKEGENAVNIDIERSEITLPIWLRLERKGNQYRAVYSKNGRNWNQVKAQQVMNFTPQHVGIGLCAQSMRQNGTMIFAQPEVYDSKGVK